MTELKVDTVVDLAGTGKPNFSTGLTINGAALHTLNLSEYTASGTEPSSPYNGSVWWDTTNEVVKIYIAGEWKETIGIAAGISWGGSRGFRLGGSSSNIIEYFDISSSGNAQDFGDIGGSSKYSGSYAAEDQMQYITTSTAGNATNFGNLTVGRYDNFGASNGTRGVFMGGYSSSYVNTMD